MNIKHIRSYLFGVPLIMAVAFSHVPTQALADVCSCSGSGNATKTCLNSQYSSTVDTSLYWYGKNGYYFGDIINVEQITYGLGTWNTFCREAEFYTFWPGSSKRIKRWDVAAGEGEDWEINVGWMDANLGDLFYGSTTCKITAGTSCFGSDTSHGACKVKKVSGGCVDDT